MCLFHDNSHKGQKFIPKGRAVWRSSGGGEWIERRRIFAREYIIRWWRWKLRLRRGRTRAPSRTSHLENSNSSYSKGGIVCWDGGERGIAILEKLRRSIEDSIWTRIYCYFLTSKWNRSIYCAHGDKLKLRFFLTAYNELWVSTCFWIKIPKPSWIAWDYFWAMPRKSLSSTKSKGRLYWEDSLSFINW